jgi:hypothetical protein
MKHTRTLLTLALIAIVASGCASSRRTTIEGYSDASLNRKRIFLLLPGESDVRFASAEQYAQPIGIAAASAGETFAGDLRSVLVSAIQSRLDSNAVFSYADQPVSGIVPLSAAHDFTASGPNDWDAVRRAGQEGAIDFLLVLRDASVANTSAGDESVTVSYELLDVAARRVMTSGVVTASVGAPRTREMTHEKLADELTAKLPFLVR